MRGNVLRGLHHAQQFLGVSADAVVIHFDDPDAMNMSLVKLIDCTYMIDVVYSDTEAAAAR